MAAGSTNKRKKANGSTPHEEGKRPTWWQADAIEQWSIDAVIPYEKNARVHSDGQVARVADSIRTFGFTVPLLVDEQGVIIAGHGRLAAAKALELEKVPVIVARDWPEERKRAYRIADNQLALLSTWDEDVLVTEISDLISSEDITAQLMGFDSAAMDLLIARTLPYDAPERGTDGHWRGMPEARDGEPFAFRSVALHFRDAAAVDAFAALIKQRITENQRTIWFPEPPDVHTYSDKRYVSDRARADGDTADAHAPKAERDQKPARRRKPQPAGTTS